MSTLAKRATPSQVKILRIVAGAVINEADAHGRPRDQRMARSIAKRATGSLSAQWPEILAARSPVPSEGGPDTCLSDHQQVGHSGSGPTNRRSQVTKGAIRSGVSTSKAPLRLLRRQITSQMWYLRRYDPAKADAFIEILKMINEIMTP
jgi:hypothetical protein